jgi:hypothetical protein
MFVADLRGQFCAGFDSPCYQYLGLIGDEQCPARASANDDRIETVATGIGQPETGVSDPQLSNDFALVADPVQDLRTERSGVERDRGRGVPNPELRLDAGHFVEASQMPESRRSRAPSEAVIGRAYRMPAWPCVGSGLGVGLSTAGSDAGGSIVDVRADAAGSRVASCIWDVRLG